MRVCPSLLVAACARGGPSRRRRAATPEVEHAPQQPPRRSCVIAVGLHRAYVRRDEVRDRAQVGHVATFTRLRVLDPWPISRGERYSIPVSELARTHRALAGLTEGEALVLHTGGRRAR